MQPDDLASDVITIIDGAVGPLLVRLAAADVRIADLERQLAATIALTADLATLGARLAVVEATTVPGPPGPPGPAGPPGPPGPDGLGFDDLTVSSDGERTLTLAWTRGELTKAIPIVVAWPLYRGVYADGVAYDRGDVVTSGGSAWSATAPTRSRPGDDPSWRLMVQRGKAGRNADREQVRP